MPAGMTAEADNNVTRMGFRQNHTADTAAWLLDSKALEDARTYIENHSGKQGNTCKVLYEQFLEEGGGQCHCWERRDHWETVERNSMPPHHQPWEAGRDYMLDNKGKGREEMEQKSACLDHQSLRKQAAGWAFHYTSFCFGQLAGVQE